MEVLTYNLGPEVLNRIGYLLLKQDVESTHGLLRITVSAKLVEGFIESFFGHEARLLVISTINGPVV